MMHLNFWSSYLLVLANLSAIHAEKIPSDPDAGGAHAATDHDHKGHGALLNPDVQPALAWVRDDDKCSLAFRNLDASPPTASNGHNGTSNSGVVEYDSEKNECFSSTRTRLSVSLDEDISVSIFFRDAEKDDEKHRGYKAGDAGLETPAHGDREATVYWLKDFGFTPGQGSVLKDGVWQHQEDLKIDV